MNIAENQGVVAAAISAIMGKVGSVEKRGKNAFHNYEYATAADIAHKLQKLMAEEGLLIFQTEKARQFEADGAVLTVTYHFILAHKTGATWPEDIVQTGMSGAKNAKGGFDDKAMNKCHTAARKYFLLGLFQIPTGDYDDADAQEDRPAAPPVTAPVAKPRPSAPPVDPETGEFGPHLVDPPEGDDKTAWTGWGGKVAAAFRSATNAADLEAWVTANVEGMKRCATDAPRIYNRLHAVLGEQRARLTPVEDVFGLKELPEESVP